MSLITRSILQKKYKNIKKSLQKSYVEETQNILHDQIIEQTSKKKFNIFLSHSYWDASEILALKQLLNNFGFSVFVDWENEEFWDRNSVNKETAQKLKNIMDNCDCLLYAFTPNSIFSKWMPWELGYFDGRKGKVAIVPILDIKQEIYKGTEYLSLYPYLSLDPVMLNWFGKSSILENRLMVHYPDKKININTWFIGTKGYNLLPFRTSK